MKRLIQRGLMFGNLIEVSSPALIERYIRAMKHLTGNSPSRKSQAMSKERHHVRFAW